MASTQVILLERVDSLGAMGEVVNVRPGYARNYLLPQRKALRATKDNVAYYESQKAQLQAENDKRRKAAEKDSSKVEGLKIVIIRQASEGGQMYGSVTARDIAEAVAEKSGLEVERNQVILNQNFKLIGLFPVEVALHPEVKVEVMVNIARSNEEAEVQEKTGKAMIASREEEAAPAPAKAAEEAPAEETAEEEAA